MIERFQHYFENLELLSTEALESSMEKLVRTEARNAALVIAHLAEMSRRKSALERGYKSLFDYAVKRLNLSEGSVALRLQVANVSRRFPEILVALAENRISLSVAGLLAPHLTKDNVEKLLSDCAGMTKRSVEEYLVGLKPRPVVTPSVRKQPSPSPPATPSLSIPVDETTPAPLPETKTPDPPPRPAPSLVQPATPEQYNFRFAAGREFKEKLERLAEVLGVENPTKHVAEILEQALEIALDRKDPRRKLKRRRARERQGAKRYSEKLARASFFPESDTSPSRYVASEVVERLHESAGYQCEFEAADGTRCTSRTGLEVEHTRPFAIYRSHDERFLKLFCKAHNRLSAERVYGATFIQGKIDSAREQRKRTG